MILYDILQGIGECIGVLYHFQKIKQIPPSAIVVWERWPISLSTKGYLLLEENRDIMFNISDAKVCVREGERGKEGQGSRGRELGRRKGREMNL